MSLARFRRNSSNLSTSTSSSSSKGRLGIRTLTDVALDERGAHGLTILYDPPQPVATFVFVHGLGGGSRKTWSKTASNSHYWPQEWLPTDIAFRHLQILTFGYDSDWIKGKSNVLNIHHFGKALLADLNTSPYLQREQVPIVLIGHSMGGCVIKKAYILAKQDVTRPTLAERIHDIVFLATPHRGADLAKVLSHVLDIKSSSRAYVDDLQRCSEALQTINDEFRNYSGVVGLWSFYETQKLQRGILGALVVTTDSATLGYREERQIPMAADHRSICKFDGPGDPNYLVIRNSLATIVKDIIESASRKQEGSLRNQTTILRKYLGVTGPPEDDLAIVDDARLSGTCGWLSNRRGFEEWHDFKPGSPALLLVNGKPASGKSVLAGYVVNELQVSQSQCSYYFFKHGDKAKSQLSACLRSLAFQMACCSDQIRSTLVQMHDDEVQFDKEDERVIWRKLFLGVILLQDFGRHFWVIDALDECANTATLFESILPYLSGSIPLRVLMTSRENPELARLFGSLGQHKIQRESITDDDTLRDMKLLVETKGNFLMFFKDEDRSSLMAKVMEKASGCFLWTVLVMNELSCAHSEEEVNNILEEVPKGMEPLYARALESMSRLTRTKPLVRSILIWVTCALRPLSVGELKGALELDLNDTFPRLAESVSTLCCQLVTVDKFGKIQMIHETARQFLLNEDLQSEFAIAKASAHSGIAKTCLEYLVSDELKPPRASRRGSAQTVTKKRNEFSNYASFTFAEHLVKADPQVTNIPILAEQFLTSNVLSWIEILAEARDLDLLIRTSNRFKAYSNAVAANRSPLCPQVGVIRGWTTDLVRIAAKFGEALLACPRSIFSLIIPFCPSDSTISKCTAPGRGLSVAGLSPGPWDDRLASISFQDQTSVVSHGEKYFAVGLNNGSLILHHAGSCQEYKTLYHGEAVKFVRFKSRTNLMASCGLKIVHVWDIRTGEILHSFKAPLGPIGMVFDNHNLMVASYKRHIAVWDLASPSDTVVNRPWYDSDEEQSGPNSVPCAISFSTGHKMLAIGYAKGPVTLWDIEVNQFYGSCCAEMANGAVNAHRVMALVLNPNPQIDLLAVSYLDGLLVLFDPFQDRVLETLIRANCFTLASSSDGQLLAAGAGRGLIQIYAFDTLRMLYQIQTANSYIKQLAFSIDSLRLTDIRGAQCNIWEPVVLLREAVSDRSSEFSNTSVAEGIASDTTVKISAMCVHPGGEGIFCGRDDGLISVYSLHTGLEQRILHKHKSRIRILTYSVKHDILISVDVSNVVTAWRVPSAGKRDLPIQGLLFQSHMDCEGSISQVTLEEASGKFIVSTRYADYLHTIAGVRQSQISWSEQQESRQWIQDSHDVSRVLCVSNCEISVHSWDDWSKLASLRLTGPLIGLRLKSVRDYRLNDRHGLLLELTDSDSPMRTVNLQVYDTAALGVDNLASAPSVEGGEREDVTIKDVQRLHEDLFNSLSHVLHLVLGLLHGKRLVFLDIHSWVCSVALVDDTPTTYSRHFFVPRDWFSGMSNVVCDLWQNDVIFAHNNDTAVVKGALNFSEEVGLPTGQSLQTARVWR